MSSMTRKTGINESGGMFAAWNYPEVSSLVYMGLHALQHRGQTSAGIVTSDEEETYIRHDLGLVQHVFDSKESISPLKGKHGIGQVRSASEHDYKENTNIQPFMFKFQNRNISVSFNGNVTNAYTLRSELEKLGAVFQSDSSAELLVHLICHANGDTFEENLQEALAKITGAYNFMLLTTEGLFAISDEHNFHTLEVGKLGEDQYVVASETCALDLVGASFIQEIPAGHYVKINDEGIQNVPYSKNVETKIEPMEFIYFARPDSTIGGVNVHHARKNMGVQLAKEAPAPSADIVIGIPNSSLSAATGYAEEVDLPYELGLVKHQYIGRTFIEPTQAQREVKVRRKLAVVKEIIKGKSVVVVDDSIVRGTTILHIVKMLREAEAKEVHIRIAAPMIRFPNYYGIDLKSSDELYAARYDLETMNENFGSDSLAFLSTDGLVQSVPFSGDYSDYDLSLSSFNGDYIEDIGEYKSSFDQKLTDIQKIILKENN